MFAYESKFRSWEKVFTNIQFPSGIEFSFAFVNDNSVYITLKNSSKLYCFPLSTEKSCTEFLEIGEFQYETQNVTMVDSILYNFSSDQFDYLSTVESFDIRKREFSTLFKSEDQDLDFSPYYSFGCLPMVKLPTFKLPSSAFKAQSS